QQYNVKEIELFRAIEKLLEQGFKLHELKVADITRTARMGKGTAYDYFNSKDEILRGAIRYRVTQEFERFHEIIQSPLLFRDKFMSSLDLADEMMHVHLPRICVMMQTLLHPDLVPADPDEEAYYSRLLAESNQWICLLLKQGAAEGYLHPQSSETWRLFAFRGVIMAYVQARQLPAGEPMTNEQYKQAAWNLMLRALGKPLPDH
ncbi:MAG: TetR/AcrR family transcriptional regulator, partial [Ruminococcaceae bacterium]|nr:TetR/AcrR family transcriptional regulator [Oscillospiraceae bacterium]